MIDSNYLKSYKDIIIKKYEVRKKTRPEGNNHKLYLDGLTEEVQEVKDEIKENNHVYLEDELGDIFWDYLNMLFYLEKEGLITNIDAVFERSFKKYLERIDGQVNGVLRKEVKEIQKKKITRRTGGALSKIIYKKVYLL